MKQFLNVAPEVVERLRRVGIVNAQQMLARSRMKAEREALSRQSGLSCAAILELVKQSDLSRIFALKGVVPVYTALLA